MRNLLVSIAALLGMRAPADQRERLSTKFYKWSCGRAQRLEELWGKA
ncbi:MAG: hypothetical protein KY464_17810 [Gemmatimonadetes bacterium]|nr:hypothetical protein [Gemmatimonadota bacterium]